MLPYSGVSPVSLIPAKEHPQHVDVPSSFQHTSNGSSQFPDSSSNISSAGSIKDIYVCTFCQVFSPLLATVSEHIASSHSESLPSGTCPESFVSKLKPLQANTGKPARKRSTTNCQKTSQEKRFKAFDKKQSLEEPILGPGGLFWCKTCLRSFRKPRQLTQHICLDSVEQDSFSNESSIESEDEEFRTYVDIDPIPWSRRKLGGHLKDNLTSNTQVETVDTTSPCKNNQIPSTRALPNWRSDPSYIPLFKDENEKVSFEEHLKSIDYSCVDTLFRMQEKRCRTNKKKNCIYVQSKVYSCNCCKKVLKSLSHMRLHCLTHTDFNPFSCNKCTYCTNSKGSLYIHMRKHTGNMFSCSFCDFKSVKRAHMLDHEATHSSVPQLCKLCKNSYKTQRSLIAHVRKYHSNPGGRRYVKLLTSKGNKDFKCEICKKNFKSYDVLQNHNQVCHEHDWTSDGTKLNQVEQSSNNMDEPDNSIKVQDSNDLNHASDDVQGNDIQTKDPLAEIVLNNLLQQEQSEAIIYNTIFNESSENVLPSNDVLLDFQTKAISVLPPESSSILEECQKTINLDILNECLQNAEFSNECDQEFGLQPNLSNDGHSLPNGTEIDSGDDANLQEISEDKIKPAEIKLFEKCQRAPAYVCCVCSAIYICPTTLKAHLKEHLNSTTSSALINQPDEQFEASRISDANSALDNVCEILQNSSEACSFDEELEKLYTSSLDMIWYLPEVSVVLENDPALIDSVLDDISNFPMV